MVVNMKISYRKLWILLLNMNMTKTDLREKAKISTATLAKMSKNEPVALDVLFRICTVLRCDIGDIMEFENDRE